MIFCPKFFWSIRRVTCIYCEDWLWKFSDHFGSGELCFFFEDSLIDTFGSPSSISVIPVHMLSKKSWIFNSKDSKYMSKAMGSTFCIGFLADIFELIFRNTIKVNNFRGYRKNLSVFTCFLLYEISGKVYQPWQMPT